MKAILESGSLQKLFRFAFFFFSFIREADPARRSVSPCGDRGGADSDKCGDAVKSVLNMELKGQNPELLNETHNLLWKLLG